MKKNFIVIVLIFLILSIFCSKSKNDDKLTIHDIMKKKTALANTDQIAKKIYETNNTRSYSKQDVEKAKTLNQKGYNLYKMKKDKEAINFYLESIQVFPMAKTYYNLGNSLMNIKKFSKAEVSYLVALNYRPGHHLYNYNLACCYSLQNKINLSLVYLKKALETGYNNFAYIWRDPDMKNARRSSGFDKIIKEYASTKLTKEIVIKEGYCEVDEGILVERFSFKKDGSLAITQEGQGPYSYLSDADSGFWYIKNGLLKYRLKNSTVEKVLYLKLGKHQCSH